MYILNNSDEQVVTMSHEEVLSYGMEWILKRCIGKSPNTARQ